MSVESPSRQLVGTLNCRGLSATWITSGLPVLRSLKFARSVQHGADGRVVDVHDCPHELFLFCALYSASPRTHDAKTVISVCEFWWDAGTC
jgi:hypothetical protein